MHSEQEQQKQQQKQKATTQDIYKLYKMDVSYFSGKVEAYLRYKGIPYEGIECLDDMKALQRVGQHTGVQKVPAIEMPDGLWLHDTTPMMQWLEQKHGGLCVLPTDPALRFVALLIEDYADEWLWRPAMWWRWMPKSSRVALGRRIAKVFSKPLAGSLGFYFAHRQMKEWLWDDGVTRDNIDDVRDMLFRELEFLEPLFEEQPFILGSHPSVADFGYFASFFRHFGNDPISAEVVRREGPNTHEWLGRLWNAKPNKLSKQQEWVWPKAPYWQPLLARIAQDYLPYLHQNALAFQAGQKRFDHHGTTFIFKQTKTTHYRVWCRQELQREFTMLTQEDQSRVTALFENAGGLATLHQDGVIYSGMTEQFQLPIDPTKLKHKPSLMTRLLGQPRN